MYLYMLIYACLYTNIFIYVMTHCNPPNNNCYARKWTTPPKLPERCHTFHSCLGVWTSVEQYRLALIQDTSSSDALPTPKSSHGAHGPRPYSAANDFQKVKLTPNQLPLNLTNVKLTHNQLPKIKRVYLLIGCFIVVKADPVRIKNSYVTWITTWRVMQHHFHSISNPSNSHHPRP